MNKAIFTYFCLFMCVIAVKAQRIVCLQTKKVTTGIGKTIPTRDIIETQNGVRVTYVFNNILLHDDPLYNDATVIGIDGFWPSTIDSEPAVLSRWDTFIVPSTGADVVVSDSSYVEFPMEISPARPILTNSGNETYTTDNVKPINSYCGFYPSSIISASHNDSYRGQRLFRVCVSPVQYDYANKKVRVFTMIQYNIQYNTIELRKCISRINNERLIGNTYLNNTALNIPSFSIADNSKDTKTSADSIRNKYLIISVPKYAIAVNKFAEWKRTLGFDVNVEMRDSWTRTMVYNVINNEYQYLLIVGGYDDVPSLIRYRRIGNRLLSYPTDFPYGLSNGYHIPDIYRGRIPVNTSNEAMNVVDKIINYERDPVNDDFFYKRGVHCAYFQDSFLCDGREDRRFVLTSERIRNSILNDTTCNVDSITRVYYADDSVFPQYWNNHNFANGGPIPNELLKPNFAWDGDSTDITSCINQKALYVLMRDHGNVDRWIKPLYTSINFNDLNNGKYLPVVFSICCLTGNFSDHNCFCENLLKVKNGGCVAIFGATQSSLSGPNDVLAEGMFDAICPSLNLRPVFGSIDSTYYSPTPSPTYRLGQILDQGLYRCNEAYFNIKDTLSALYTSEIFHCFGDPSMMIYTEKPQRFTNAIINRQSDGMIYVNTGGILATISFYNRRTKEVWSYIGYSVLRSGDSETSVCISAHNMIPAIDEGTLYIQNQTLTSGGYYKANSIIVGKNVTQNQPQGNVNFSHGKFNLDGNKVVLHSGTNISVGAIMKIGNR